MILDEVLAKLEAVRDKLNASVQNKGVNIADNSTLYKIDEGVNQIPQEVSTVAQLFYKCASVDTSTMTWTGYLAVQSSAGLAFNEQITQGLTYTQNLVPAVDNVYSKYCTYQITGYWNVLQDTTLSIAAQNTALDQTTSTLSMQTQSASYDDTTNTVNIVTT